MMTLRYVCSTEPVTNSGIIIHVEVVGAKADLRICKSCLGCVHSSSLQIFLPVRPSPNADTTTPEGSAEMAPGPEIQYQNVI